jgi:hypothetical protein
MKLVLNFSDAQMLLLKATAATLPVQARDEFFHLVVKALRPTDPAVQAAIAAALARVSSEVFVCCSSLPEHAS